MKRYIRAATSRELDDIMQFNDKYFPRVDVTDGRYQYYSYKGHDFAYDTQANVVMNLFKDEEEVSELGEDNAPWRELEGVGLKSSNWSNKQMRNEYLDEWIFDMEAETARLTEDFIKNELPYYQDDAVDAASNGAQLRVRR